MAITIDTIRNLSGTASQTYSITPSGSPIGVVVLTGACYDITDRAPTITYGGVALERIEWGATAPGGEQAQYGVWALKSGVPQGTQDLVINYAGTVPDQRGSAFIITGDGGSIEVADSFALASYGGNLDSGEEEAVRMAIHGNGHFQGSFSIPAGWTQSNEFDYGSMYMRAAYKAAASGSVSAAFSGGQGPLMTAGVAVVAVAAANSKRLRQALMVGV